MKNYTLKSKFKLLILTFLIMIFIANPIISFGADNLPEYLQVSIDKTEVNMGDVVRLKLSNLSTEQIDGFGDDRGVRYLSAKISYNKDVFELNEDGFYRPLVDYDICTDCGLCTKLCYKFDKNIKLTIKEQLAKTQLYAAWSNNDDVVKNTTSGGIGDLLACQLQKPSARP